MSGKRLNRNALIERAIYFNNLLLDENFKEAVEIRRKNDLNAFISYCKSLCIPTDIAEDLYELSELQSFQIW